MITVDSPIIGKAHEPFVMHLDTKKVKRLPDVTAYMTELARLCELVGFNWQSLFAQAAHETDDFTSHWWESELNPAGIGIFDDGSTQRMAYKTGTDAARAQVVHMCAYVFGPTGRWPAGVAVYESLDPRLHAVATSGFAGTVKKLGDLGNGKWATDPRYAEKIAARANQIFKDPIQEEPMAKFKIVGLPGDGIELPVPLIHDIISKSQPKQRPGIKRQLPGFWVQHETGNPSPGADAEMHNRYLHNGAQNEQGVSQTLSFHFTVDDGVIYQMIPIDEVTWQAADGNGPGNMSGISCELCINHGIDAAKARANAEALCGGIMRALGMGPERIKRHWDFNANSGDRHHCPDQMMSSGYWPTFVANAAKIIAAGDEPEFADPAPVPWKEGDVGTQSIDGKPAIAFLIEVEVNRKVVVPQVSETDDRPTGIPRKKTTKLRAIGCYRDEKRNAWIVLRDGSRVKRSDVRPLVPLPKAA